MSQSDRKTTDYMNRYRSAIQNSSGTPAPDKFIDHYCSPPLRVPEVSVRIRRARDPVVVPVDSPIQSVQLKHKLNLSDRNALCSAVSLQGVVVGLADHSLKVVSFGKGGTPRIARQLYSKQHGHSDWVSTVCFLPDGRIVSGGMDSKLCMWTGTSAKDLLGHVGSVSRVRPLGLDHIVSSAYDRSIKIWSVKSGKLESSLHGHEGAIIDFIQIVDSCRIASAGRDSTVRIWDPSTGKQECVFKGHKGHVACIMNVDQNLIASGAQDASVKIWDIRTAKSATSYKAGSPGSAVTLMGQPSQAPQFICLASSDGSISIFDIVAGKVQMSWSPLSQGNFFYSLSVRGTQIITGSGDGVLCVWTLTGDLVSTCKVDENAIRDIQYGFHNDMILVTDDGNLITV